MDVEAIAVEDELLGGFQRLNGDDDLSSKRPAFEVRGDTKLVVGRDGHGGKSVPVRTAQFG